MKHHLSDRDLLIAVSDYLGGLTDMGPADEGWKSPELQALTNEVERRAERSLKRRHLAVTVPKDTAKNTKELTPYELASIALSARLAILL